MDYRIYFCPFWGAFPKNQVWSQVPLNSVGNDGTYLASTVLTKAVQIFWSASPFVFYRRQLVIQVWNNIRVSKGQYF